jgi:hypothetical protein
MSSTLGILTENFLSESKNPIDGKFSISDESRQYLGKYNLFLLIVLSILLNRLSRFSIGYFVFEW